MTEQEKLLALLNEFHELGIDKQIGYNKFYLYSLITHSTAIEGSTVTEIENQLLFDEGITASGRTIKEHFMNIDLKNAYDLSVKYAENGEKFSIEMLQKLAAQVMKNTGTVYHTALGTFASSDGDLRLLNVTAGVGGKSYMNYSKVPHKLKELCEAINTKRRAIDRNNLIECYTLSFDFHFYLLTIHPWADGNGRMSRLIMNQLQFEFGIIPSIIHKERKASYIEALVATREADDLTIFRTFMFAEHSRNIEKMIADYKASQLLDLQW